jgi:hypothetical protein
VNHKQEINDSSIGVQGSVQVEQTFDSFEKAFPEFRKMLACYYEYLGIFLQKNLSVNSLETAASAIFKQSTHHAFKEFCSRRGVDLKHLSKANIDRLHAYIVEQQR